MAGDSTFGLDFTFRDDKSQVPDFRLSTLGRNILLLYTTYSGSIIRSLVARRLVRCCTWFSEEFEQPFITSPASGISFIRNPIGKSNLVNQKNPAQPCIKSLASGIFLSGIPFQRKHRANQQNQISLIT